MMETPEPNHLLGMKDNIAGMRAYQKYLALYDKGGPKNRGGLFLDYCRGRHIESKEAKQKLIADLNLKTRNWTGKVRNSKSPMKPNREL